MIPELDEYEELIKSIIDRVPLLKTAQLSRCLYKMFKNVNQNVALDVLLSMQRRGYVLLSEDGWAMSKGMYKRLTADKFYTCLLEDSTYRLPCMQDLIEKSGISLDIQRAFWIVIDMLPTSIDFVVNTTPWLFLFDTSGNTKTTSKLYEVAYIPADREDSRCELLRQLPEIEDAKLQSCTVRVALVDDKRHSWMVPHIGFRYICSLKETNINGFEMAEERRGKKVWSSE